MNTIRSAEQTTNASVIPVNVEEKPADQGKGFLYPERHDRPIVIRESLLAKIVMGLFCSTVVAIIMNFGNLKWLAVHLFAFFLTVIGKDSYIVKPTEAVKQMASDAKDKVLGKAGTLTPGISIGHKTPEQLKAEAEQREIERKRREASETQTLTARAGVIGFKVDNAWPLERLRVEVTAAEKRAKEEHEKEERRLKEEQVKKPLLARATQLGLEFDPSFDSRTLKQLIEAEEERLREEEKKKPYFARAIRVNFTADPAWDFKTLKEQVLAAEHSVAVNESYQAAMRDYDEKMSEYYDRTANGATCPFCNYTFKTSRTKGEFICPSCNEVAFIKMAHARYKAPPPPRKPEMPSPTTGGLLGRFFK